jgi:hypothetical protein
VRFLSGERLGNAALLEWEPSEPRGAAWPAHNEL